MKKRILQLLASLLAAGLCCGTVMTSAQDLPEEIAFSEEAAQDLSEEISFSEEAAAEDGVPVYAEDAEDPASSASEIPEAEELPEEVFAPDENMSGLEELFTPDAAEEIQQEAQDLAETANQPAPDEDSEDVAEEPHSTDNPAEEQPEAEDPEEQAPIISEIPETSAPAVSEQPETGNPEEKVPMISEPAKEVSVPVMPTRELSETTQEIDIAAEVMEDNEENTVSAQKEQEQPEDAEAELMATKFCVYPDSDKYINVVPGGSATMKVVTNAPETEKIIYQWYHGNTALEGETKPTLRIKNVKKSGESYHCIATNEEGTEASMYFNVYCNHLNVSSDATYRIVEKNGSTTLKLSVTADKKSAVTYQWYEMDEERSSENRLLEGETKTTLKLSKINSSKIYYCSVEDTYGNSVHSMFYIFVNNFRAFAKDNEQNLEIKPGGSAALQVEVEGDNLKNVTYQWGVTTEDEGRKVLDKETAPNIFLKNVQKNASYYCEVNDGFGNTQYVWFSIKVNHLEAYVKGTSKSIDLVNIKYNGSTTLAVYAKADRGKVSYQWGADGEGFIKGATGTSLKVKNIKKSIIYWCDVTDTYGNNKRIYFQIYVRNLKAYVKGTTLSSKTYTVNAGASRKLEIEVKAEAGSDLSYSWLWAPYQAGMSTPLKGTTSATVPNIQKNGVVFCYVQDQYGNQVIVDFTIKVQNKLKAYAFSTKKTDTTVTVAKNKGTTLKVKVTAADKTGLTYSWFRNYNPQTDYSNRIFGANSSSLKLSNVTRDENYTCIVEDKYGTQEFVTFHVVSASTITKAKVSAIDDVTYTGTPFTPSPVVTMNGTRLKKGTDYKLTYADNTEVGVATVTIKGLGKYSGFYVTTFKILPKKAGVTSLTAAAKGFTVKWKKQATQTSGYQIQYSTSKNFKSGNKAVKVKDPEKVSKKITGLKAKTTYYVRVRTYKTENGITIFSGWSVPKTVKTK